MSYKIFIPIFIVVFLFTSCTHLLYKELVPATEFGHLDSVQYHIEKSPKRVHEKNKQGQGLLFLAAKSGNVEVVDFLIEKGANINSSDKEGRTALMAASALGHYSVVKYLVRKGANINMKKTDDWNALMFAMQFNHRSIAQYLIDRGATGPDWIKPSKEAQLIYSSQIGDYDEVEELLKEGINVNSFFVNTRNTALHKASKNGHSKVVRLLIKKGANRNMKNRAGKSALMLAKENGHKKTARILMRR